MGRALLALGAVLVLTALVHAAPFTPGNLVVSMVDGSDPAIFSPWMAYSDTAGQVVLYEFTTALPDENGETPAVQTIVMPTTVSGAHKRFTLPPGTTGCGQITRSTNGLFLVLAGYDADIGTPLVVQTPAATVNRVIALVDANGQIDTRTGLTDCYQNGTKPVAEFRMAATEDGTKFWLVGKDGADSTNACTRFALRGATTSLRIDADKKMTEPAGVNIYNGQLYVSAWNNNTRRGIVRFGTGLPDTAVLGPDLPLIAPSPPTGNSGVKPRDFWFQNDNTLYVADQRAKPVDPAPPALPEPWYGGVEKFLLDTNPESLTYGQFVYQYTLNAGLSTGTNDQAMRSITGTTDANEHAVLYAIWAGDDSGANKLMTLTDTGCPTGTEEGCTAADTWITMHTAPGGTVFRGVEWVPRPCVGDECHGACCHPNNRPCTLTSEQACDGVWEGVGTICENVTCPAGICNNPFADIDGDTDVDMEDFAILQRCITSGASGLAIADGCNCFDRPEPGFPGGNGIINADDVLQFTACGSGPGVPADTTCDGP